MAIKLIQKLNDVILLWLSRISHYAFYQTVKELKVKVQNQK